MGDVPSVFRHPWLVQGGESDERLRGEWHESTNWIIEHKGRSYSRPENTLSSKVGVGQTLEVSECGL